MFFWNSLAFSMSQRMLAIWSLVPLPFLKPAWTSGSSRFTYCWSLAWRILSITLLACEMSAGADCGSDHELLVAKFRLKLKKVGKAARPSRYDLNQISYDYSVEVRNWFKGWDLIDRVPDELWDEVCDIVQETGIQTIPMEKKGKKAKWLSGRPYK